MQRTTLLGGMTKIKDYDLTSLAVALTGGGVYEGLVMSNVSGTNWKVTKGKGLILCTTTGGTKKIAHYELDADYTFTLSGNFKCRIQVGQTNIDDPTTNSVDGSGISAITTGASYPASNYIPLGSVTGGVLTLETQALTVLLSRLNLALYGGDIGANAITTSGLVVSGTASMPTGTLFGGSTITSLINAYMTGSLLTQFGSTDLEFRTGKTSAKFPTMNLLSKYLFPKPWTGTTYTVATPPNSGAISGSNVKICDVDVATAGRYTYTFTSTSGVSGVVSTNVVIKLNGSTTASAVLSLSPSTNGAQTMNMTVDCVDGDNIQLWTTTNTGIQTFTSIALKCSVVQNLDWILDYVKGTVV